MKQVTEKHMRYEEEIDRVGRLVKNYEKFESALAGIIENTVDKKLQTMNPNQTPVTGKQEVSLTKLETTVKVKPTHIKSVEVKTDKVEGKILWLYSKGMFNGKIRPKTIADECYSKWGVHAAAVGSSLNDLVSDGILVKGQVSATDTHLVYWLAEGVSFTEET